MNLTGHTFEAVDPSKKDEYSNGLEASFEALRDGLFVGHDFFDTTTALLNVTVAGGGECCNIHYWVQLFYQCQLTQSILLLQSFSMRHLSW